MKTCFFTNKIIREYAALFSVGVESDKSYFSNQFSIPFIFKIKFLDIYLPDLREMGHKTGSWDNLHQIFLEDFVILANPKQMQ